MKVSAKWLIGLLLMTAGLAGAFASPGKPEPAVSSSGNLSGTLKVQLIGFNNDDTTDPVSGNTVIGVHYLKEQFEKLYPNISVQFIMMGWDSYTEKTQAMLQANQADVVQVPGIALLASQGLLEPLQPYIDRDKFDLGVYIDNQVLGWKALGPSDKQLAIYGLPFIADTRFIVFDKLLFDQWKVKYLSWAPTPDELKEKGAAMTGINPVTGKQNYGLWYKGADYAADTVVNLAEFYGGRWGTGFRWSEMKTEFNSPEFIKAATWLKDVQPYCPPGVSARQGNEKFLTVDNDIAISLQEGPGVLKPIEALKLQGRIGISRLFINEKLGMGFLFAGSPAAIGVKSQVKDLAWQWIKFTASETFQRFFWDQYRSMPTVKSSLQWPNMGVIPQIKPVLQTLSTLWGPRYPYRAAQPRYILGDAVQRAIMGKQPVVDAMNQAQSETEAWLKAQ
jgi:multiple sugar transport system substrate-binding protein